MTITEHATTDADYDGQLGRPASAAGLNLRPTAFGQEARHSNPSPCPSWCIHAVDGVDHELQVWGRAAGDVEHSGEVVDSRASLYPGSASPGERTSRGLGCARSRSMSPVARTATPDPSRSTSTDCSS